MDLDKRIGTLLGAVTDQRTKNVRYRQNQLQQLHAALLTSKNDIQDALCKNSSGIREEAEMEFFLATDSIRQFYQKLDFEKSIEEEYLVTAGKNNIGRRVEVGLAVIRPTHHSPLYSVIVPLAAAITAGNCVLLEIETPYLPVDSLLATIVPGALDQDSFHVSNRKLTESQISRVNLLVNQVGANTSNSKELCSSPSTRSIAVVDRSADCSLAAKKIVNALLFGNGTSPYAPHVAYVNEFVVGHFNAACLEYASSVTRIFDIECQITRVLEVAEANQQIRISRAGTGLLIVQINDRNFEIPPEINSPLLFILSTHGLVDTTTLLSPEPTKLSTYLFGSAMACKFFSEQIPSNVSYINQIPGQLLFGPASPSSHRHQLHPRYTPEMFSQPRPQIIELIGDIKIQEKGLKPTGQKPGHAIGFFEQGILMGLGVTLFVIIPSVSYGVFYLGRAAWKYAALRFI